MKDLKYLTGILFLLCVDYGCKAQSVSIDHETVPVTYYRMPDEPLDPTFTTYSADIDSRFGDLAKTGYTEQSLIDEYMELPGYKKVNRDGDVEIGASIGDFNVISERTDIRHTKTKDKSGKETDSPSYAVEIKYSLPISIKLVDKKGKTLEDEYIFTWSDEKYYTTAYYNSQSELETFWRTNRTSKLAELLRDRVREGFGKIADLLSNKYGYKLVKENTHFETIGKKKHPDYDQYAQEIETIKSAFKLMDPNHGLEDIKNKVKPALDFFNAKGNAIHSHSKDDTKLKHINLYNQALAWYWLEDFDQATQYATELQKMDNKDKEAKRLLDDIHATTTSLENANKSSRHGTMVGGKA